jgi:hypothetical protein
MPDTMHGYTKLAKPMGDHVFAAWLRKHGAVDTWRRIQTGTAWYGPQTGAASVAVCSYHGDGGMDVTMWIRTELMDSVPTLHHPIV